MERQKLQQILDEHRLCLESNGERGKRADLRGANLQRVDLQEENLQRANLRGAYLRGAYLRGANLRGADLRGANLQGANLQGANLQGANLQGANLQGANLQGANLQEANLQGAELQRADLLLARLVEANLQEANLHEADLQEANLQEANLQEANLLIADLRGANLLGADLRKAELRGADLRGADLRIADLRGANLLGVKLEEAKYNLEQLQTAHNVPPEYLSDAKPASADVYQRRAEENQSKVIALEREKRELEAKLKAAEQGSAQSASLEKSLKDAENELNQVRSQLEQNRQKQKVLDELAGAIEPILEAVKSDKDTVEDYKRQSQRLLKWGLICFGFATGFIIWKGVCFALPLPWQALCATQNVSGAELLLQIAPGFVLAILGSALLRHDWKIRQLTLKLIDQNNSVDIAMGMLKTALRLSNIGEKKDIEGIPDLVKESFAEARRALLYRNRSDAPAPAEDSGKDAGSLKRIEHMLARHFNPTNPPSS